METKPTNTDKHPTPAEQTKIKAWDEAVEYCNKNCKGGDHTYSVAHAAYLAGHASRDKEVDGYTELTEELQLQITALKKRINELEGYLSQIAQMSDPGSPERFVIEAKRIASKAEKV